MLDVLPQTICNQAFLHSPAFAEPAKRLLESGDFQLENLVSSTDSQLHTAACHLGSQMSRRAYAFVVRVRVCTFGRLLS